MIAFIIVCAALPLALVFVLAEAGSSGGSVNADRLEGYRRRMRGGS